MKKFTTLGLLALSALVAFGQAGSGTPVQWSYQSFMSSMANSITVSNALMGITNLNSTWLNGSATPNRATNSVGNATNVWGTSFTNNMGVASMVTNNAALTNTFGTYEFLNLLQDVNLFPDRNSTRAMLWNNIISGTTVSNSMGSIYIKLAGQSGANAAVNFYFVPLPDGTNETTQASGEEWVVGVTAAAGVPVSVYTNVPAKFNHCRGFRLRAINNVDTDASSRVDVTRVGFIGFGP